MTDGSLAGRAALVTGGTLGIGLTIARALMLAGADIIVCSRTPAAVDRAVRELRAAAPERKIYGFETDVSEAAACQRLVAQALASLPQLDILVNAAGIYGPKGRIDTADWNDWVRAIEIDLYGSVLPIRCLLPHFFERGSGKIIQLSGGGATKPLPYLSAYATAKAGLARFCETLAEEVRERAIDINLIAPGAINTRLLDEVLEAGPEKVGEAFYAVSVQQKESGGQSPVRAAELAVFLASRRSDGITGRLLSAIWDDWDDLPNHRERLEKSDIFTLRRILPSQRGESWGEL